MPRLPTASADTRLRVLVFRGEGGGGRRRGLKDGGLGALI
jgi:hypothetical protein